MPDADPGEAAPRAVARAAAIPAGPGRRRTGSDPPAAQAAHPECGALQHRPARSRGRPQMTGEGCCRHGPPQRVKPVATRRGDHDEHEDCHGSIRRGRGGRQSEDGASARATDPAGGVRGRPPIGRHRRWRRHSERPRIPCIGRTGDRSRAGRPGRADGRRRRQPIRTGADPVRDPVGDGRAGAQGRYGAHRPRGDRGRGCAGQHRQPRAAPAGHPGTRCGRAEPCPGHRRRTLSGPCRGLRSRRRQNPTCAAGWRHGSNTGC